MKSWAFYDVIRDMRYLFMAGVGSEIYFCRVFKPGCYSMEQKQVSLVSLAMVKLFSRKSFI